MNEGDTKAKQSLNKDGQAETRSRTAVLVRAALALILALIPLMAGASPAFAGVENMMSNLQSAILNVLAPIICVGGIIFAGFKLAMGDESAKRMLWWSCIGTVITFTAPSILSFLQTRVAS